MLDDAKDKRLSPDLLFVWLFCMLVYLMYAPRSHLRKGALRPHYYNYFVCLFGVCFILSPKECNII